MNLLVINSGSSSLRFELFERLEGSLSRRLRGKIGGVGGRATLEARRDGAEVAREERDVEGPGAAAEWALRFLHEFTPARSRAGGGAAVDAVGHRVVHGGDRFREPVRITEEVLEGIDELDDLSPLHNPASLAAIRAARSALGERVPMVAVFDTGFHATLPDVAAHYALPAKLARKHRIRRYGFHGLAHASLAGTHARLAGEPLESTRLITLQLGNGVSAAAIRHGLSVDTTMGFTPLEGLVMGTRSGDLDPAVVTHLAEREGLSAPELDRFLNTRCGLLGVSGRSRDVRELLEHRESDPAAALAIDLFCYRVKKAIGSYLATLNGADAIVFGGGIGENNPLIRQGICESLEALGVSLDAARNEAAVDLAPGDGTRISAATSPVAVWVAGTDEERLIAEATARVVEASRRESS